MPLQKEIVPENNWPARPLKVITLNHWLSLRSLPGSAERSELILRFLEAEKPDIFFAQELAWPFFHQFAARLAPHYQIINPAGGKATGKWTTLPRRLLSLPRGPLGSGLAIFLRRSLCGPANLRGQKRSYFFKIFPSDIIADRCFLFVRLRHRETGTSLALATTHLSPYPRNIRVRTMQLEKMLRFLKKQRADWHILGGDFNFRPDSPEYQMMLQAGYRDAEMLAGSGNLGGQTGPAPDPFSGTTTWPEDSPFFDHSEPPGKIDYIWARPAGENREARVTDFQVLFESFSDHYPVRAGLELS